MLRWGPTPASGYTISALRTPKRPAIHDERGTITFAELAAQTNALARGLRELGVAEGDSIAIFCRDHPASSRPRWPPRSSARACCSEHLLRGAPDRRGLRRREPEGADLRRGVRGAVRRRRAGRTGVHRLARRQAGAADATIDALIAPQFAGAPVAAARSRPRRDPDLGHDRHPEGGLAPPAALARPGRRALLADSAARARDDADRGAAVSLLGLRPLHARPGARLDARPAAPLRSRADARRGRAPPRRAR